MPIAVAETMAAYRILDSPAELPSFLSSVFSDYIATVTARAEIVTADGPKPKACELCERSWIPLTQHHLVPRAIAAKAIKRGWVDDDETGKVAWLCRACHSFVHRIASHEELARGGRTIDQLLRREQVQKWTNWIGGVRWMPQ